MILRALLALSLVTSGCLHRSEVTLTTTRHARVALVYTDGVDCLLACRRADPDRERATCARRCPHVDELPGICGSVDEPERYACITFGEQHTEMRAGRCIDQRLAPEETCLDRAPSRWVSAITTVVGLGLGFGLAILLFAVIKCDKSCPSST